jgi:dephospho-CoA kinase
MAAAARAGVDVVVLDIPLLFEKELDRFVGATVVVSAPYEVQRARVLARPGMTEEKFRAILDKQMPDAEKRRRADYVIDTGTSLDDTRAEARAVMTSLRARR